MIKKNVRDSILICLAANSHSFLQQVRYSAWMSLTVKHNILHLITWCHTLERKSFPLRLNIVY